jgi:PIN domain nuclease of toxin-antitoxin system
MKLLLDTHTLLWSIGESHELSQKAAKELENSANEIVISAVSLWEIALKYSVGKLDLFNNPVGC